MSAGGVLRCVVCGDEIPRDGETKGLEYGWPKCHGQSRVFISADNLKKERQQFEAVEDHEIAIGNIDL